MRRINLDYQQAPEQPRRVAGWMLLIAGVALFLEMGISYDRLLNEREAMSGELQSNKHFQGMSHKVSGDRQYTEDDYRGALLIMQRLSAPWEDFFAGLESIKTKNVAMLSIEPDIQTGRLLIEGEAKDYAAVLTLVSRLRRTKPFSEVYLSHHEIKRGDPQHPTIFTLSMRWAKSADEAGIYAGGSQQQDLAAFFDSLPAEEEITDILASISAIADATGVELKQVDYRLNEQDQPHVEYVMNFPVRGEYVRIRAFLSLVLSKHPALALDHAGFQRDSINDSTLKAMVQLTLFIRPIK